MKKFSIVIPTRNRLKKLYNVLNTIPESSTYVVKIACDGDKATHDSLKKDYPHVESYYFKDHRGSVWCRNEIIKNETDGVLPCVDDIVFPEGYFDYIFDLFNTTFPDDDGVLGVRQQGEFFEAYSPTGMALIGKEFLSRYPDGQLYYPRYYHFAAQEIYNLCKKIKEQTEKETYKLADKYVVKHGKALYSKSIFMDMTHKEARRFKKRDLTVKAELRKTDLGTWGTV
jgi:glycosyltransferase involved in cell wall biosynthesis